MQQVNFQIEENSFEKLKEVCQDGQISEFIRKAIDEKLNRKTISMDETYHWLKKLDKLDTESVYKKTADVEFTSQVIFEEIKKQNEVLKLILRRASFGGAYSGEILGKNDPRVRDIIEQEAIEIVESEIKEIKI